MQTFTVLLVEDSEDNRGLIRQWAEEWMDIRLLEATDGGAALAIAAEMRPDLILMDLSLPVVSGWEATTRLKADPELAHIPVVVLTAHAMEGDEGKARAAGCDAFLTKPVDLDELEALLLGHMKRDDAVVAESAPLASS